MRNPLDSLSLTLRPNSRSKLIGLAGTASQAQEERWVLTQKQRESSQSPRAEMLQPMEERAVYQPGAARKTVVRPVESAERRGRSAHSARRPGH
jgi:hypothetical protein